MSRIGTVPAAGHREWSACRYQATLPAATPIVRSRRRAPSHDSGAVVEPAKHLPHRRAGKMHLRNMFRTRVKHHVRFPRNTGCRVSPSSCNRLAIRAVRLGRRRRTAGRAGVPPENGHRLLGWAFRRGRSLDLSLQEGQRVVEGHPTGARRLANRHALLRGCTVRFGIQCLVVPGLDCADILGFRLLRANFGGLLHSSSMRHSTS